MQIALRGKDFNSLFPEVIKDRKVQVARKSFRRPDLLYGPHSKPKFQRAVSKTKKQDIHKNIGVLASCRQLDFSHL